MEFLMDPSVWAGLLTLVILEIVLGIDNLVFIAILVKKLPPHQRDKARVIGLSLALIMRLALLSVVSWLVTLTTPLITLGEFSFSGRDLILMAGGLFLLFKATSELHERLEGKMHEEETSTVYAGFGVVIAQILVLDAVFSLDSIITAVGMVDSLAVMMIAVVVAMVVMLAASKSLTDFVNAHPTVVVLCLSFLLMIGFSLVAEGFGFHIPKGYLYAAIGFSILIEFFNQLAQRNKVLQEAHRPLRERTTDAIFRLMGGKDKTEDEAQESTQQTEQQGFVEEERNMISGVLSLAERSIRTVMTPRSDIVWLDVNDTREEQVAELMASSHSQFPVCDGELDNLLGVVRAKDLMAGLKAGKTLAELAEGGAPIIVPDSISVIRLLNVLRDARGNMVLVNDEFGTVQGLVTPHDLLEAIVGEFLDEDEDPEVITEDNGWLVKGSTDLHYLEQVLSRKGLVDPDDEYATLAGMLLALAGQLPEAGAVFEHEDLRFEVTEVEDFRIAQVRITPLAA
ncbi:TerC family protein [Oceanimonas sp. CHS3-5]|uniref:TerC family protein n=1 Tax=Oceanimonas sp. CHS3-5 TaxID=3068186 RepID=UPI00273FB6F5|nr:TerC family protein [Oceanimonas sp. CHS3-5]MDP5293218.1 TerC family protein [Oceanimonas sp. CHS3-5]